MVASRFTDCQRPRTSPDPGDRVERQGGPTDDGAREAWSAVHDRGRRRHRAPGDVGHSRLYIVVERPTSAGAEHDGPGRCRARTSEQATSRPPGLTSCCELVARLAQQLAVLLLGHPLAALLDDGAHGVLTSLPVEARRRAVLVVDRRVEETECNRVAHARTKSEALPYAIRRVPDDARAVSGAPSVLAARLDGRRRRQVVVQRVLRDPEPAADADAGEPPECSRRYTVIFETRMTSATSSAGEESRAAGWPGWSRSSLMLSPVPPGARRARAPTLRVRLSLVAPGTRRMGDAWDVALVAQHLSRTRVQPERREDGRAGGPDGAVHVVHGSYPSPTG